MLAYVGQADHALFGVKGNEVLSCIKHGFKSMDFLGLKKKLLSCNGLVPPILFG